MNQIKLPEQMRAIAISEPGDADVLQIIKTKLPDLKPDEVLIEVKACGINRPDIVQRQGHYPPPAGASEFPGLEVAGIICAVGENVSTSQIGTKVAALLPGGGYAEYTAAHKDCLLPIPDNMSFTEAAAIPETFFTVWSNIFDQCNFKADDIVLVHGGSSGIGVAAIQLVKYFGGKVIITAGSDEKCQFCLDLGADFAINYRCEDFVAKSMEYSNNHGADIILDIVGGNYVNRNYKAAAKAGRIAQIAFLESNLCQINLNYIMRKKLIHTGSTLRGESNEFKGAIAKKLKEKLLPALENGSIKAIIDKIYDFEDVVEAHRFMESNLHKGKIILNIEQ